MIVRCKAVGDETIPRFAGIGVMFLMATLLSSCAGLTGPGQSRDGPGMPSLLATGVAEQPRNLPKSRYGNPKTYSVFGKQYSVLDTAEGYQARGIASW